MERSFTLKNEQVARTVFGRHDQHLKRLRERFGVKIAARGRIVRLSGDDAALALAAEAFARLVATAEAYGHLRDGDTERIFGDNGAPTPDTTQPHDTPLARAPARHEVEPRSIGQRRYLEAMKRHDIVFCLGPAGTGKTFLAVATAVEALRAGRLQKLILTRPAVEAGEKLGFLPGDFQQKVNPYMQPLYDALRQLCDARTMRRYLDDGIVEVAPLAYMRGRTLERSFLILDEAQNTTHAQMKMFLTRLGPNSKAVVTGDVTQIDLPTGTRSGFIEAIALLEAVEGIATVRLTTADIVRHPLVARIVDAYEAAQAAPPLFNGAEARLEERAPQPTDTLS